MHIVIEEYQEKMRIILVYQEFFRLKEKKRGIALSLEKRVMGLPDYGQMKGSHKVLAGTTYCRLHKPKTKGLYSGQKGLMDEKQKFSVDCKRGLYTAYTYT